MRFLFDENLSERAAILLRQRGYDAITVRECGRGGLSDEDQLAFAAEQERILVTQDLGDFGDATDRFFRDERIHFGVLLVPRSITTSNYEGLATAITRYVQEHPEPMQPFEIAWLRRAVR